MARAGPRKPDRRAYRLQPRAGAAYGHRPRLPGRGRSLQRLLAARVFGAVGRGIAVVHRRYSERSAGGRLDGQNRWDRAGVVTPGSRTAWSQRADRFAGAIGRRAELVGGAGSLVGARAR